MRILCKKLEFSAQVGSRRVPTELGLGHMGFVVDKVALGQVFYEYFGFPC
jgi:hypothetical protein